MPTQVYHSVNAGASATLVPRFVKGRIFTDPSMPSLKPVERTACYNSAVETLAKLHAVDHEKVSLPARQ